VSGGLHIGLLINPLAGLGGSLALKGSDGNQVRELAVQLLPESRQRAQERTVRALRMLQAQASPVCITTWAGDMGESALQQLDFNAQILGSVGQGLTTARDTRVAVEQLCAAGVDIIVFAGGDGTACDIYDVVGASRPVLGIPAGVKMHSGVFAVSPEAAG